MALRYITRLWNKGPGTRKLKIVKNTDGSDPDTVVVVAEYTEELSANVDTDVMGISIGAQQFSVALGDAGADGEASFSPSLIGHVVVLLNTANAGAALEWGIAVASGSPAAWYDTIAEIPSVILDCAAVGAQLYELHVRIKAAPTSTNFADLTLIVADPEAICP